MSVICEKGILGMDLVELRLHRLRHGHVRGALGLEDAEGGGRTAVQAGDGTHLLDAVVHLGDVAQAIEAPAPRDDLRVREILRRFGAAQHPDRLLAAPDLGAAARGIEIQRAQLLVHLDRGEAESLQARRIELDADLAAHAAAARHLRDAREPPASAW